MASGKMGAFLTDLKGSVGGTTFQGSRGGLTVKMKGHHGKVKSWGLDSPILERQIAFSEIAKRWQQLNDFQRGTWSTLLGQYQFVNKFGDIYNGSAYQIYTSMNLLQLYLGLAFLTNAPTYIPTMDAGLSFTDFSLAGVFDAITLNGLPVKNYLSIEGSQLVTNGTSTSKLSFKKAGIFSIQAANTVDHYADVMSFFGSVPVIGQVFYIRTWYTRQDCPKKQFLQTHKITVTA